MRDAPAPESNAGSYCATLPPRLVQLDTSVVTVQPWPLHEFMPLQDELADLQALVPLHELTPTHFTPPAVWACAVVTMPAAKIAEAVAARVLLFMSFSRLPAACGGRRTGPSNDISMDPQCSRARSTGSQGLARGRDRPINAA